MSPKPLTRHICTVAFLTDGQLSTRQLADHNGTVTDSYTYDAFGNLLGQTGSTLNNYLYTGEQFDPNAGFYYLRARYYDQFTGRFTSVDPWKGSQFEPVTLHRYLYAGDNPVMNVDPSGENYNIISIATTVAITLRTVGPRITQAFSVGGRTLGRTFRALGRYAEKVANEVIALEQNVAAVTRNVYVNGRYIDFFLRGKDLKVLLEVKYSLPARLGPAMDRLVAQITNAVESDKGQVVLWTLRAPRSRAEINRVIEQLGPVASKVNFVHGVEDLHKWLQSNFITM